LLNATTFIVNCLVKAKKTPCLHEANFSIKHLIFTPQNTKKSLTFSSQLLSPIGAKAILPAPCLHEANFAVPEN
jgi:hypothetical protein